MNATHVIVFGLLGVKGVGFVQANKILNSIDHKHCMSDASAIKDAIASRLTQAQRIDFQSSMSGEFRPVSDEVEPYSFVAIHEENYPARLIDSLSKNAPTILSCQGNLELFHSKTVGFCGSRKASQKGLDVTIDCVEQLVQNSITIVSGYASGVDHQAHYAALKNGGKTIIVLPEGIAGFRIKKELANVWDWNRVLVISEFVPQAAWTASRAMQRNNTIIGLSDAMILIEAGEQGGSMDAGKKTLAMGKWLFAPVYIDMPVSAVGNEILLKQGATALKKSSTTMRANVIPVLECLGSRRDPRLLF